MLGELGRRIYGGSVKTLFVRAVGVGLLFAFHVVVANRLGTREYGSYSFVLAIAGILAHFAAIGLPTALLRLVGQYREQHSFDELKGALTQLPLFAVISSALVSVTLVFVAAFLPKEHSFTAGVELAALVLPLIVLDQIRRNVFNGFRLPVAGAVPDEIIRPVVLGSLVWLFALDSALNVISFYVAISFIASVGFLWWLYRTVTPMLKAAHAVYRTRYWLLLALPMAFGHINYLLMNRTDVIVLSALENMEVVGVYAAANRVAMLCQLVLGTAAMVVAPMLAAAYHAGRIQEFRAILNHTRVWISVFVAPLFLVMVFAPVPIMQMFGREFVDGAPLLRVLAIGQIANAVAGPVGIALLMTDKQKVMGLLTFSMAMLNLILNLIAIPIWGAMGAALATVLCIILLNLSLLGVLRKSKSYRPVSST